MFVCVCVLVCMCVHVCACVCVCVCVHVCDIPRPAGDYRWPLEIKSKRKRLPRSRPAAQRRGGYQEQGGVSGAGGGQSEK